MLEDSHCSVKLVIVACGIIQSEPKIPIQMVDHFSSFLKVLPKFSCIQFKVRGSYFLYFEILYKFAFYYFLFQ